MSQFTFLQHECTAIFDVASKAEATVHADLWTACCCTCQALELVRCVYDQHKGLNRSCGISCFRKCRSPKIAAVAILGSDNHALSCARLLCVLPGGAVPRLRTGAAASSTAGRMEPCAAPALRRRARGTRSVSMRSPRCCPTPACCSTALSVRRRCSRSRSKARSRRLLISCCSKSMKNPAFRSTMHGR